MRIFKYVLTFMTAVFLGSFVGMAAARADVDLIVQSIVHNSATNQVEVTVKNQGTDSLPGSYHYLYISGSYSVYKYVPVPAAGSTLVTAVNLSELGSGYQVGSTYYMYAYADWYSYVSETIEYNNGTSAYVWIRGTSQPELRIASIADGYNTPNITVNYVNSGSVSSPAPAIRVSYGSNVVNVTGASLAANASGSVSVSKSSLGLVLNSYDNISATIDPNNVIAEGDEYNNSLTSNVYVTAPVGQPDLQVTSVALDSTNTKINVTYTNTGASFTAYSYLAMNANNVYKYAYVAGLAQNASATVQFNVSDFGMTAGNQYSTFAYADWYNYVTESSESNNSNSVMLYLPPSSGGGGGGSQPDLVLQDLVMSYGSVGLVVKNQGGTAASAFYGYIASSTRSTYVYISTSNSIAPGETKTYWISGSRIQWYGGSLSIFGEIDHWNYLSESNENNNSMTKTLTYTSGP